MTTRAFDASYLTQLKRDRNEATYFRRQNYRVIGASVGAGFPTFNPQTGRYDDSRIADIKVGGMTTYYKAYGKTVVNTPCSCKFAGIPESDQ